MNAYVYLYMCNVYMYIYICICIYICIYMYIHTLHTSSSTAQCVAGARCAAVPYIYTYVHQISAGSTTSAKLRPDIRISQLAAQLSLHNDQRADFEN